MGKKGLKCILLVLGVFAATYMSMVIVFRLGTAPTFVMGLMMLALGIALLFGSMSIPGTRKGNYCGIFSGLLFWAVLGEACEKLFGLEIAEWRIFPLLGGFAFLVVLLAVKKYPPVGLLFALSHFGAIWLLHFLMINQLRLTGPAHWITYLSCAIFALSAVLFGYRMARAKSDGANMAYALSLLLVGWTVLEYVWAWRLLPGPWMLAHWTP